MTYAVSYALQLAVYQTLASDASLSLLIDNNLFDAPPSGTIPQTYVVIGDEVARDKSSKTSAGAMHEFVINVVSDTAGFSTAKQVAVAVCDALIDVDIALARGTLCALNFHSARAVREDSPGIRQIDLKFRAFVEDT
jgi:hypothetical protein